MVRLRVPSLALIVALGFGCDDRELPTSVATFEAGPNLSSGAAVYEAARGSGHFTRFDSQWRTFTFQATKRLDGTVEGNFGLGVAAGTLHLSGDVICLTVLGNEAWMGGIIRRVNEPDQEFLVGWAGVFRVVDQGEASGAPPDQITLLAPDPDPNTATDYCRERPDFPDLQDIEAGAIQVSRTGRSDLAFQRDANLWVMNADGSGQSFVAFSAAFPAWSPDGRKIAFHDDNIWVVNADGTGLTLLVDHPAGDLHPAWSPDGTKIAFNSNRNGNGDLFVMNADGSGLTQLTFDDRWDERPAWSPDGSRIAFDRDGDIWVMNADGTGAVQVTFDPAGEFEPDWSPDGKQIAFFGDPDGDFEIYVMNADGTGLTQLTHNASHELSAQWSRDGRFLALQSDQDGDEEIFVMKPDGTGLKQLTFNDLEDLSPAWR